MISMKKVCGACDSQFDLNKLSQIAQTAQPALADRPHDAQIAQTTVGARTCAARHRRELTPAAPRLAQSLPRDLQRGRNLQHRRPVHLLPLADVVLVGRCHLPALEGGLLYRVRVPVGAEHPPHPRVTQAAHARHLQIEGLMRRLRDGEHRRVAHSTHGELQALCFHVLTVVLPPHETNYQLADQCYLPERVPAGKGHPGGITHLQRKIRQHLAPRKIGTAFIARVGADPHNLMVEPRTTHRNALDKQSARPHAVGIQVSTHRERGRNLLVGRHAEQGVLGGQPNVVALAAQGTHVRVVMHDNGSRRRGRSQVCER
mmetsp:Transcript_29258/g.83658  ORF Transcript_29258/g.83658 Transcript_29258/m.83658 type:complete len:316 (-) Transcript_29258:21-968(-)